MNEIRQERLTGSQNKFSQKELNNDLAELAQRQMNSVDNAMEEIKENELYDISQVHSFKPAKFISENTDITMSPFL